MLRPALLWSLSFAGLAILLGFALVGPQNISAITSPHIAAPVTEELAGSGYTMNAHLEAAVPLLILGTFGAVFSLYRRNWLILYPLAWAALAYVLVQFLFTGVLSPPVIDHNPGYHDRCCGGWGEGILLLRRLRSTSDLIRVQTLLGAGAVIGFVLVSIHYWPTLDRDLMNRPRLTDFSLQCYLGKVKSHPHHERIHRSDELDHDRYAHVCLSRADARCLRTWRPSPANDWQPAA